MKLNITFRREIDYIMTEKLYKINKKGYKAINKVLVVLDIEFRSSE